MRLIDADALFEFAKTEEGSEILDHSVFKVLLLRKILDNAPTIEAELVRHGEWGPLYGTYGPMVCSECGGEAPSVLMGSEYEESQYCPTCGAKMDGGEKE